MNNIISNRISKELNEKSIIAPDELNILTIQAWNKETIFEVITKITANEFVIIGGEVYDFEDGHMICTHDCWSYNVNLSRRWRSNVRLSKKRAIRYINDYLKFTGGEPYFTVSFETAEEITK